MRAVPRQLAAVVAVLVGAFGCGGSGVGLTREQLLDPLACASCHPDHYREWSGSMHAYAADDPVFLAMNRRGQRETGGALGAFCVKCHAPMAVREGLTTDGLNLDVVPRKLKGVTCFFCHSVSAVEGTHDNPLKLGTELVLGGGIQSPISGNAHKSSYSPFHDRERAESAALCGSCHDVVTPHGALLERSYLEWQASVFSRLGSGATCGQCHMEQSAAPRKVAELPDAPLRRTHGHLFAGIDVALTPFAERDAQRAKVQAFLDTSLQTALCVQQTGDSFALRVILDNVAAGHSWPSGAAQDRRAWTEVVAYEGSHVLYQSGVVPDDGTPLDTDDPDLWLLRDCIFDQQGREVHMFWEAAESEGNLLPALSTFDPAEPRFYQTHILQSFPRAQSRFASGVPDRVTLRVRLQPIGKDILDSLVASGDLAPAIRDAMPTFDVGSPAVLEWTPATATQRYFENGQPVLCVTQTNLNVAAEKVPAPARTRCR